MHGRYIILPVFQSLNALSRVSLPVFYLNHSSVNLYKGIRVHLYYRNIIVLTGFEDLNQKFRI